MANRNDIVDTDSEDELPAGWEERVTTDGKVYYANHFSQATQWKHPVTGRKKHIMGELPFGWEQKVNKDGLIYYVNHVNETTTYTDPRLAFAIEDDSDGERKSKSKSHRQRFDGNTRAMQVLVDRDLRDKYAIVTGANSGIGYETARTLAFHGAHVVFACRNMALAQSAVANIGKERPLTKVKAMHLDLMNLSSVRKFAEDYVARPLHMLILNAAVFCPPYTRSDDGFESTFQTNHLGHFYLVHLLSNLLVRSAPARVVIVSSESHRFSDLSTDTISCYQLSPPSDGYSAMAAYNQSKLCNVLFTAELERKLGGQRVHAMAVHPGNVVSTSLPRHSWFFRLIYAIVRPFTKDKQQAAATSVFCATARELESLGATYFNNCCECYPSKQACNQPLAEALWNISLQMLDQAQTLLV